MIFVANVVPTKEVAQSLINFWICLDESENHERLELGILAQKFIFYINNI